MVHGIVEKTFQKCLESRRLFHRRPQWSIWKESYKSKLNEYHKMSQNVPKHERNHPNKKLHEFYLQKQNDMKSRTCKKIPWYNDWKWKVQTLYSACCITTFARLFGHCEKYALSTKRTTAVVNVNSKISLSYRRKKVTNTGIEYCQYQYFPIFYWLRREWSCGP